MELVDSVTQKAPSDIAVAINKHSRLIYRQHQYADSNGRLAAKMEHTFERLVRFESDDGTTLYGDVTDASAVSNLAGATVNVLDGNLENGFSKTTRTATIKKVRI